MFKRVLLLAVLLLVPIVESVAQAQSKNAADERNKAIAERQAEMERYRQNRNADLAKYQQERKEALEKFEKERAAAIDNYQKAFERYLGRGYSYEKDTSNTKTLVESALRDSIAPQNLVKSVQVLEEGEKKGVKTDDVLDVARMVQVENRNVNVSAEQMVAFSEARKIAEEKKLDMGVIDEKLYNALRKNSTPDQIVDIAKSAKPETPPPPPPPAPKTSRESIMQNKVKEFYAAKAPYVWGGNSIQSGVDCSGFTTIVYRSVGMQIPRHSGDQFKKGTNVTPQNAKYGDLIFFYDHQRRRRIGHVGMVERINENGEVVFVHSSRKRNGVGEDILKDASYWKRHFAGIRRVGA